MKVPRKAPPALALLLPLLALAGLALLFAPEKAAARQEGQYAGIDQCAACHEETVTAFKESIHGKKGFEMRSPNACESSLPFKVTFFLPAASTRPFFSSNTCEKTGMISST